MSMRLIFIVLTIGISAASTAAQWSAHAERLWSSDVATIDIHELSDLLQLSPEQRDYINTVLEEHRSEFDELVNHGRIVEDNARWGRRNVVPAEQWQAAREELTRLVKRQRALQKEALSRIAPVLSDAQRELWQREQMALRRDWWLDRGSQLTEAKIDLIALLDQFDEDADSASDAPPVSWRDHDALAALMDQYAAQLDALIIDRRDRHIGLEQDQWDRLVRQRGNGSMTPAERDAFHRDLRALGRLQREIRDLNRHYRTLVMGHLSIPQGKLFQDAYRAARWPYQGINRLPGRRLAETLLDDESLAQETREMIQSMLERYRVEGGAMLDAMADSVDEEMLLSFDADPSDQQNEKIKLRTRRQILRYYGLDDALLNSLWDALPPGQRDVLTKPKPKDREWLDQAYPDRGDTPGV